MKDANFLKKVNVLEPILYHENLFGSPITVDIDRETGCPNEKISGSRITVYIDWEISLCFKIDSSGRTTNTFFHCFDYGINFFWRRGREKAFLAISFC